MSGPLVQPVSGPSGRAGSAGGKLRYGGGDPTAGVGVVTTNPRVYLVFWGAAWQTPQGDPQNAAQLLQNFFSGLGTNHELWSGTALQYCQNVPTGSTTCPSSAPHVQYPLTTVLAGTPWFDTTHPYPANLAPTGSDLAQEAQYAAQHFGNTTQSQNLNTQYVVASPSAANPDGWLDPVNGYCAYHDNTSDPTIDGAGPVAGPDLPFTNLPYVADAGAQCGAGSVNNPGLTDGVTIVESHEYGETLTDPFPSSGWTDRRGNEIGDKCEFLSSSQPGGPGTIVLTTGSFPVQGMWANNSGRLGHCLLTEPTIAFGRPPRPTSRVGRAANLQVAAVDGVTGTNLTYGAAGLPPGLSINPATGLVSGTPTTAGRPSVTVTASDNLGFSNSETFLWRVRR